MRGAAWPTEITGTPRRPGDRGACVAQHGRGECAWRWQSAIADQSAGGHAGRIDRLYCGRGGVPAEVILSLERMNRHRGH